MTQKCVSVGVVVVVVVVVVVGKGVGTGDNDSMSSLLAFYKGEESKGLLQREKFTFVFVTKENA